MGKTESSDFSVTIYLNQAVVFDLLAIMEDGMSQVSSIKISESNKHNADAGIGASNVFALLGVTLKGGIENVGGRETSHRCVKERGRLKKENLNGIPWSSPYRPLTKQLARSKS